MSAVIEEGKVVAPLPAFSRPEDRSLPALPAGEQASPMAMLALAVQRGMDPATIKDLMELGDRWEAAQAKKAFDAALAAFKADPPELHKNKKVSFETSKGTTSYSHATLDEVSVNIGKALAPHGLSHRWDVEQLEGGMIRVTCVLAHSAGHAIKVPMQAGRDESGSKNNIQGLGSTVTYLQRYTLLSATGMAVKGADDDGAGSEGEDPNRMDEKTLADHIAAMDECGDIPSLQATFTKAYKAAQELKDKQAMGVLTRAKDARKAGLQRRRS